MRLTIIPSDQAVYVDTVCKMPIDLSSCGIPSNIHALQWYSTRGWIEFSDDGNPFTPKPPNQEITELPSWATNCVTKWQEWTPPEPEPIPDQPTISGA